MKNLSRLSDAFGIPPYDDGYSVRSGEVCSVSPDIAIDLTPITDLNQIDKILAEAEGEYYYVQIFIVLLKDGRYAIGKYSWDYTFDSNNIEVANTLEEILQFGISKEEQKRLAWN